MTLVVGGVTATARAQGLAGAGRAGEAVALLRDLAGRGDAEATFTLALWFFEGRLVARDLAAARAMFGRAAAAGHAEAGRIHVTLLANGTGGPRRWREALAALARADADSSARRESDLLRAMSLDDEGEPRQLPEARTIRPDPRILVLPKLLSRTECDFLIAAALPLLAPSVVIHPQTGAFIRDPVRTSDAAAFPLAGESPAIHAFNRRIAAATGTAASQGEPLQVLSYQPGQQYRPHLDTLPHTDNQRIVTVLVYLNDDYEGGETVFPALDLAVRGEPGDALVFANVDPTGRSDERLRHAGRPVTRGRKLLASRWIRARPLDLSGPPRPR